ncbi:hypothetical protein WAK64_06295 [Bacillus spongiae]|uniref:Glycogen biosynthesis protein GlgD n=1 Tax=Bacillus spongiae TaxID=2683610 RepID=A0ABU8HBH4_9BACI
MAKEKKQPKKDSVSPQNEEKYIRDLSTRENGQPLPQPKDYDEIDY